MGRRSLDERHIRKLIRGSSSYLVTLPIQAIRDLGWKKSQKLVVELDRRGKRLIIKDWER